MNTLQYKEHEGSVLYSAEDHMLHGRVIGIRDMISYGGADVQELKKNFCDAKGESLAFSEETNKVPGKPSKGSFNIRIGQTLHQRAARFAEEHDRKLNAVIVDALQEYLAKSA